MFGNIDRKPGSALEELITESTGQYIFEILDVLDPEVKRTSESVYTNLRGIFLRNLRHDEKLALSHEDFILFYVLTILHPDLPVFIREKYFHQMGSSKRILDFKTDVLTDAEEFLSDKKDYGKHIEELGKAPIGDYQDILKMEIEDDDIIEDNVEIFHNDEVVKPKVEDLNIMPVDDKVKVSDDTDAVHFIMKKEGESDDGFEDDFLEEKEDPTFEGPKHEEAVTQNVKYYHCDQCEYVADRIIRLRKHRRRTHKLDEDPQYIKDQVSEKSVKKPKVKVKSERKRKKLKYERDGDLVKCDQCDFTSQKAYKVKLHIKEVHEGVRYECDLCDFTSKTSYRMGAHKKKVHEGQKFCCDICDFEAPEKRYVARHKALVHEKLRFPCDLCDYEGTTPQYLRSHKEAKHLGIRHYCDQCTASFNSKMNLNSHIKHRHEGKGVSCDLCDYKGFFNVDLQRHIENKHPESVLGEKKYLCDQCDYATNVKGNLTTHQNQKHFTNEVLCDKCDYRTNTQIKLQYHIEMSHGPSEQVCQFCDFTTMKLADIIEHSQRHHPDQNHQFKQRGQSFKYMCDKCAFKTNWYPYLTKHNESKHGTKVYACDLCEYTTLLPNEFKKHWGYRHDPSSTRIPCDQCHFSAPKAEALKHHIEAVHLGIRYPCDTCEYSATSKGDLNKHKKQVHENIRIRCNLCNKTFKDIHKHMKIHKARQETKHENQHVN